MEVPRVYDKDIKDIKCGFKIEVALEPTRVVVIAIYPDVHQLIS